MEGKGKGRGHLPSGKDAAGFSHVETRCIIVCVKANDERRYTERTDATGLCIALLDACNVPGDELDRDGVLDCQAMRLAFYSRFVDQDPSISSES